MTCKKCGKEIISLSDYHNGRICKQCENDYQREYRAENRERVNTIKRESSRFRRWLNGGPDNELLGDDIPTKRYSINGRLYV
jgi:hypothetical protein